MDRAEVRKRIVWGSFLLVGWALAPESASACSVLGPWPSGAWSPIAEGRLGLDSSLLLTNPGSADAAPYLLSAAGEKVPLVETRTFGTIRTRGGRYAFFRPQAPLVADATYKLQASRELSVPFRATGTAPSRSVTLTLKSELVVEPARKLESGTCYEAPLVGRMVTQFARYTVKSEPAVPLVLVVGAHDDVSGTDLQETLATTEAPDAELEIYFPIPSGVQSCPNVSVLDYAGKEVMSAPSLCLTEVATNRVESVPVFDPLALAREAPAATEERSRFSEGCRFGAASGSASWVLAAFALAVALVRRRW